MCQIIIDAVPRLGLVRVQLFLKGHSAGVFGFVTFFWPLFQKLAVWVGYLRACLVWRYFAQGLFG